jgi:hypothetical protein
MPTIAIAVSIQENQKNLESEKYIIFFFSKILKYNNDSKYISKVTITSFLNNA